MIASIEIQVISYILTSQDTEAVNKLLDFDASYYVVYPAQIKFIIKHHHDTGKVPDQATFQFQYPDFPIIRVNETIEWLITELKKNKKHSILVDTFNKIKDLGEDDTEDAWTYISQQAERVNELDSSKPMDIVHDTDKRIQQVIDFNKQARIPTGFDEIDTVMYGGLSTVEELLLLVARTSSGKSWLCTRFMETAQKHGFNVLYYSPEMQASFLATRFDTWRGHFANNQIFRGNYSDEYMTHIQKLKEAPASAYILEDKDVPDNAVTVPFLKHFVKSNNIKELIIDGLAYMVDARAKAHDTDYTKYKNVCEDLFKLSKECGCAVIVVVQANRATKDSKDDKGQPFPTIYNIEGSDHPARIATQIFAIRQMFEKHILDIRLEKSRNAMNQKLLFSYNWDINLGTTTYIPNAEELPTVSSSTEFKVPNAMSMIDIVFNNFNIDDEVDF